MSGTIETKLRAMGYELPPPRDYARNRTGAVQVATILYVSGHGLDLPPLPGVVQRGKLGAELSVEEGYATARAVALKMLATIKRHVGELDRVRRVVKLLGIINSAPGFEEQPQVMNGASDLFYELWGPEFGQHARSAIGVAELGRQIAVEVEGIFELHP